MFPFRLKRVTRLKLLMFSLLILSGVYVWLMNQRLNHGHGLWRSMMRQLPPDTRNGKTNEAKNSAKISVFNIDAPYQDNHTCVQIRKLEPHFRICVHPPAKDPGVSAHIIKNGSWELSLVRFFKDCLRKDPDFGFIDIGTNLGLYALAAASFDRPVVAVEARYLHVKMIQQSVLLNGFQNQNFTLLHNAVSDKRGIIKQSDTEATLHTIFMDDLLEVVTFQKAIIRMDLGGADYKALRHCQRLLRRVQVPYIFTQWRSAKWKEKERSEMILTLAQNGFSPYTLPYKELQLSKDDSWPGNIIWEHESIKFIRDNKANY